MTTVMAQTEKKFRKFPKLISREVEGEFFVCDDVMGKIHSLGQVGSALWRLLNSPRSREDCLKVFGEAFPEENKKRIEDLVDGAIAGLEEKGLIY
jgi:Coenzyme PQQ synthesis protein D (PqqD)